MSGIKFLSKNNRFASNSSSTTPRVEEGPTPNSIDGLSGSNVILNPSNLSVKITVGGVDLASVYVKDINDWLISDKVLTLYSADDVMLSLTFISNAELLIGLTVIKNAINL